VQAKILANKKFMAKHLPGGPGGPTFKEKWIKI
jgi:hypothetical protein